MFIEYKKNPIQIPAKDNTQIFFYTKDGEPITYRYIGRDSYSIPIEYIGQTVEYRTVPINMEFSNDDTKDIANLTKTLRELYSLRGTSSINTQETQFSYIPFGIPSGFSGISCRIAYETVGLIETEYYYKSFILPKNAWTINPVFEGDIYIYTNNSNIRLYSGEETGIIDPEDVQVSRLKFSYRRHFVCII